MKAKAGRNDPCPCGSGRKFKKCCELKQKSGWQSSRWLVLVVGGTLVAALAAAVSSFTSDRPASSAPIWSPDHGHYHDANGIEVR